MISLPQPAAGADTVHLTVATEDDQGSRKKRKRSAASSTGTPPSQRSTVTPVTCGSRVTQDLKTAVGLLFSACRPTLQTPDLAAAPDAEQALSLDNLPSDSHAGSATAEIDGRADLPRDVVLRLLQYLEAVATCPASSGRGTAPQKGSADDPDNPLTPPECGEPAGAFQSDSLARWNVVQTSEHGITVLTASQDCH